MAQTKLFRAWYIFLLLWFVLTFGTAVHEGVHVYDFYKEGAKIKEVVFLGYQPDNPGVMGWVVGNVTEDTNPSNTETRAYVISTAVMMVIGFIGMFILAWDDIISPRTIFQRHMKGDTE